MSSRLFEDPYFQPSSDLLAKKHRRIRNIVWLRPNEMVIRSSARPQFIVKGATRFDLNQGEDGDCWFLAAVGSLAVSHEELLNRCVPQNQGFGRNYTGKFRFCFWNFGQWTDVEVDDRLPTRNGNLIYARNKTQPNEFWVPLLEKAYAKFKGGYDEINGGNTCNALVDFTGGVSETIDLRRRPADRGKFWDVLVAMNNKSSLMAAGIFSSGDPEAFQLDNGLCKGHAYSILHLDTVTSRAKRVHLIHLRNPWGFGEWRGKWSDRSREWQTIDGEKRCQMKQIIENDGEFWMSLDDFIDNFDILNLCHLEPSAEVETIAEQLGQTTWKLQQFEGALGRDQITRTIDIASPSRPSSRGRFSAPSKAHVIISLMQESRTKGDHVDVNFGLFSQSRTTSSYNEVEEIPLLLIPNSRELTRHFDVTPGKYVIAMEADRACRYLLRVYHEISEDNGEVVRELSSLTSFSSQQGASGGGGGSSRFSQSRSVSSRSYAAAQAYSAYDDCQ